MKTWPSNIDEMSKIFPEFNNLRGCPQDERYHEEGDVDIHTQMVRDEARAIIKRESLNAISSDFDAAFVLEGAAWFHDISKPECTEFQSDGSITSKGHSLKGSKKARRLLYRSGLNFRRREAICDLVLMHATPLHFLEKPLVKVVEPSQIVRCDLLGFLAEADVRGRRCKDQQYLIDMCNYYREYAQENGCLNTPWPFSSDFSRFDYFINHRDGNFDYQAFDSTKFEVIILCGLAGAGKNTWIDKNWDGPVVSLDAWREKLGVKPTQDQGFVAQSALEEAKSFLRRQQSFVWNATNITRERRTRLIHVCSEYHAKVKLVYLEVPYETIIQRNQERPYEAQLPTKALEKMIDNLEVPAVYEAPTVEYIY